MIKDFLQKAKGRFDRSVVQRFQRLFDKPEELSINDILSTRRPTGYIYLEHYEVSVDSAGMFCLDNIRFSKEEDLLNYIKSHAQ